jgi:murein DD-endopeptidase MepM/ murein hydrolase activator NlpD
MRLLFSLIAILMLGTGCSEQLEEMRERYRPVSLRDAYIHGLEQSGIDKSVIGQRWLSEGEAVLQLPVTPTLPYVEEGRLVATDVMALGYRIELTRGQQIIVEARSSDGFSVFADLYEPMEGQGLPDRRLASADSTGRLTWDARRTKSYLLRVQPEILAEGSYQLSIRTDASLIFPVAGHSTASVQSVFGVERDGGRRSHHGIDIFARRGTPVVAVRNGRVTRVQTTGLGGKQVWLRDDMGHNFYYAHLDSQLVQEGLLVQPGDTLGLVGNTGNARTTPPHLHFGIYQRGPHDPWPFVFRPTLRPSRLMVDQDQFGSWRVTSSIEIGLREVPSRRAPAIVDLQESTRLHVIGGSASWYHVRLEDGRSGYLPASEFNSTLAVERPSRFEQSTSSTVGG